MTAKKYPICIISLIIFIVSLPSLADLKDDAKVFKISGGERHTLVLTQNNWAWTCGPNGDTDPYYYGALGTGSTSSSLFEKFLVRVHGFDDVGFLEDINDISAGWKHSLALDVNGFVWAWGWNEDGQLGDGSTDEIPNPVQVKGGEMGTDFLQDISAISAGKSGEHSLAVDVNGLTYAWGRNNEGQLGDANYPNDSLTPVKVHGGAMETTYLEDIIAISAGEQHSMALDPNGFVYTWGDNAYRSGGGKGKLGIGDEYSNYKETPVKVLKGEQQSSSDYLENIVAISAGWDHSMALEDFVPFDQDRQGRVYTWGNNGECYQDDPNEGGRLGNGTIGDANSSSTPVLVLSGEQDPCNEDTALRWIVAVSAGEDHCLALDASGFVWSWGMNDYGQLGNGTNDPCTTPVKVVGPYGKEFGNIVAISAGYWHSLALDADGTLWVWGKGEDGRLGLGDEYNRFYPYPRPAVFNLIQETFYFGIKPAIDNANSSDDVIEALKGTYFEDVNFLTKKITLQSSDPNNSDIVEETIIQGSGDDYAVTFYNNEDSILSGFTIVNDSDGILCDSSSPAIYNSIIENCYLNGLYCDNSTSLAIYNSIIKNCFDYGLYCLNDSTVEVTNCKISGNTKSGVYCSNSDLIVHSSIVENNGDKGIYNESSGSYLASITNNIIRGNYKYGINSYTGNDSEIEILNNWIYENGNEWDIGGDGIHIQNAVPDAIIRNNTIADNNGYGLYSIDGDDVTVRNCIIWGNDDGSLNDYEEFDNITYSCIEGGFDGGTHNIDSDPCFVDDSNDNYHISFYSPCKDTGDSNDIPDEETDIDGEARIQYGEVDRGGDEYYISPADFDSNGIVNFIDYAILANAFDVFVEKCDLDSNDIINLADLELFCEDWLWEAPWNFGGEEMIMCMGGGGFGKEGGLMLDTEQSLIARPQRLAERTNRFYAVDVSKSAIERTPVYIDEDDISDILAWLDKIWLDCDELRKYMTEEEFLEFRKLLEEDLLIFLKGE